MQADIYIQILDIVEGDTVKASKIKKLIDENIVDEMLKIIMELKKEDK